MNKSVTCVVSAAVFLTLCVAVLRANHPEGQGFVMYDDRIAGHPWAGGECPQNSLEDQQPTCPMVIEYEGGACDGFRAFFGEGPYKWRRPGMIGDEPQCGSTTTATSFRSLLGWHDLSDRFAQAGLPEDATITQVRFRVEGRTNIQYGKQDNYTRVNLRIAPHKGVPSWLYSASGPTVVTPTGFERTHLHELWIFDPDYDPNPPEQMRAWWYESWYAPDPNATFPNRWCNRILDSFLLYEDPGNPNGMIRRTWNTPPSDSAIPLLTAANLRGDTADIGVLVQFEWNGRMSDIDGKYTRIEMAWRIDVHYDSPSAGSGVVSVGVIPCPGDVNGDGVIDFADLTAVLAAYGTCSDDPGYNPAADFDNSGCIDFTDYSTVLAVYGQNCPSLRP